MVANALSRKSQGVLASVASDELKSHLFSVYFSD